MNDDTCYAMSDFVMRGSEEIWWSDECSNCGMLMSLGSGKMPDRCPACGARVVTYEEWRKTHEQ